MAIETYEVEETKELIYEEAKLDEWQALVKELNLEGQEELVTKNDEGESLSPIPFMWLNKSLYNIFETLCPTKVDINKYNKMPIPLKILGYVKLSEHEDYFTSITVWYDDVKPDPIVVGMKQQDKKSEYYLIGRWGDELRTFTELRILAMARWRESAILRIKQRISDSQAKLSDIDIYAEQFVNGEYVYV